ncbi:integumentary mucin C.1-like [Emydura macquarii macquarii]|uniref:integumentary mucin C.1-like n=1 Tax=Emydura macquarii macquarii TaxID=1129001 RepID=UPI003529EC06
MEPPRRARLRLAAACCLLAGLLLPLPGDGQETPTGQAIASAQPSTVPGSLPLSEAGGFSRKVTAPPVTSADEDMATLQPSASSPRPDELDASSLLPDPKAATSKAPRLQHPATAPSAPATTGPPHDENLSANSSSELPPPDPAFNATEANQPGQKGTESSSHTGPTGATTGAPAHPPTKDLLATTGSSQLEPSAFNTLGPTTGNPEPTTGNPELTPQTAHENATEQSTPGPTTVSAAMTTGSTPATTTPSTTAVTHRATATNRAATTAVVRPSADSVHEQAAVLDVGDDDQDVPRSTVANVVRADPLVIGVASIFVVMVGILALVGFLRYQQRNSRMEFRRLQDLPMDDMMEDTPLSLYSY